jgi:hypothetical protein
MLLAGLLAASGAQAAVSTGTMSVPRMFGQANKMADGRVMLTGGEAQPGTPVYNSVDMYDPNMGIFVPFTPMLQARAEHGAVTLADGRVLVVGGSIANNPALVGTASAEIFDMATGQWTATGSMNAPRWRVLARLLPDGRVFVIAKDGTGEPAFAEVYDPQTGTFTKTGNMLTLSGWHGLVVLADGRVLKLGGYGDTGGGVYGYLNKAEVWSPVTNQWTATGNLIEARQEVKPVLLADGRVLVAGGRNQSSLASAEIYDPATGTFSAAPAMPAAISPVDYAVGLPGGDVLLSGTFYNGLIRYNAQAGNWSVAGPKRLKSREGTATVLNDGTLLLAGGTEQNAASNYAELFEPACQTQSLEAIPGVINLPSDGGSASLTLSGAAGCHFEVAGTWPGWLQAGAPNPQQVPPSGYAAVGFATTSGNNSLTPRSATFYVGNNLVTVTQAASTSCTSQPTLSGTFSYAATASSGTLNVNASAACPWTLTGMPAWFTLSSASGTGSAAVNYNVAVNTGAARTGGIAVVAQGVSNSYTLTQSAPASCPTAPVLSPTNVSLAAAGGSTTISVSAAATCTWTASVPSWAAITSASSGTGNGSFTFSVPANTTTSTRSGSGSVQGPGVASTFNVNQAASGSGCTTPAAQPINSGVPVNGNLLANACSYGLRGSGYYTDRYSFNATPGNKVTITLNSSAFDTYVFLLDPSGKQLTFNDDSGGSTNSRIPANSGTFTLPAGAAGSYSIQVTSYSTGKTGAYSLNLSVTP